MKVTNVWKNLSISKKLYFVIGVMATLIAMELFTLLFAMNTLSAVRSFVTGEALWSKAEKNSVLSLKKYAKTHDEKYYDEFKKYLQVPLGDSIARGELMKQNPDNAIITQGFIQGRILPEDIPGLIELVQRFHNFEHLSRALNIWGQADVSASELIATATNLHTQISSRAPTAQIEQTLAKIDDLNDQLTVLEDNFSYALSYGSHWLEHILMIVLICAVLLVESTGLTLTILFSRNLTTTFNELNLATTKIGQGKFDARVLVTSKDELGQLGEAINKMAEDLENSVGEKVKAEHLNNVKSLFLANMSHEMRTPLTAILGFTELLMNPDLKTAERQQYSKIIHRTANSLTRIINDILDLSKVEAGHLEIEKKDFSLTNLLSEIHLMLKARWSEKIIDIVFEPKGKVPETIHTDPQRLRQILMNILGNAVKFTDRGFVQMTYEVVKNELVFTVKDTGVGISPEQSQHLFEAFSQVDSSISRKYEGTGLGLVLSRRLARMLGGDVNLAEGHLGKGCTFVIQIALEAQKAVPAFSQSSSQENEDSSFLKDKNILLVEDMEDNRLLLTRMLERYSAKVTPAINGSDGVNKALSGNYDIVLMDVQMPVMDGLEATQQLRKKGFQKPIVALTAHAMKEDKVRCLNAGCTDYLTKPIQFTALLKILENNLT